MLHAYHIYAAYSLVNRFLKGAFVFSAEIGARSSIIPLALLLSLHDPSVLCFGVEIGL